MNRSHTDSEHRLPFSPSLSFALVAALATLGLFGCRRGSAEASEGPGATANEEGKALFAATCARCHGETGQGGLPLFDGGPAPKNFCDHSFHEAHTDEQIRETILKGKSTGMPPFAGALTDSQVAAIVAHVRQLDPKRPTGK